jgi:hypothetical protein
MTDYSEVYIEINQVLKSYYNHKLKNNHEKAFEAANDVASLANALKELAKTKGR